MIKKSLQYPIVYFVATVIWQLINYQQVKWMHNLKLCLVIFLFMLFFHWANIPYNWKKNKAE